MPEAVKMEPPALPTPPCLAEHLLHKNRLQEYCQRSTIPLPIYQTINEGAPHAPKFRSTVVVDGSTYRSIQTFLHRKEAEQDVAKLALECIKKKLMDEGCPLIHEDTIFCKSILNEFAVKMNLEIPTYTTSQSEGLLPVFISSLVFDGKTYTGGAGRNKKEAEQLAARTVIQSILGNSGLGTRLSQIIKSKAKLYAALHKVKDTGSVQNRDMLMGINPGNSSGISMSEEKEVVNLPMVTCLEASGQHENVPVTHPPFHELKKPKQELLCETSTGPIENFPPVLDQPLVGGPTGPVSRASEPVCDAHLVHQDQMKNDGLLVQHSVVSYNSEGTSIGRKRSRNKNKKRGQKKIRNDEQSQMPALPLNQVPSCSVAQ